MRRARVWLVVGGGLTLLVLVLVAAANPTDATEQILHQYGPVSKFYWIVSGTGQAQVTFEVRTPGGKAPTPGVYEDLVKEGWTKTGAFPFSVRRADGAPGMVAISPPNQRGVYLMYTRPARSDERFLHRIKAALGIDDTGDPVWPA
jgi:hypothetical protein